MPENSGPLGLPVDEEQHFSNSAHSADAHASGSSPAHAVAGHASFGDKHSRDAVAEHRQHVALGAFLYCGVVHSLHIER